LYQYLQYENTSSIAWNSRFAGEPCFPHGIKGIFVSGGASFGVDCVIFQQVTVGSNTLSDSKGFGAPKIGDRCYIGAGAKIVGNVKIGSNVRVGANAVVFFDVPDNSVVVGSEFHAKSEPMDNRFYSFRGRWEYFSGGSWYPVVDLAVLGRLQGQL
jgi:serine O-acetyltransferase